MKTTADRKTGDPPGQEWPSTAIAFELIEPSYGWSLQRIDEANGRIQALLSVAATITLGFPVVSAAILEEPEVGHWLFMLGLALFVVLFLVGIAGKTNRKVLLIDLERLHDKWLSDSPEEFKRHLLYFAGQHVRHNTNLVDRKHLAETWMACLFLIQITVWVLWTAGQY